MYHSNNPAQLSCFSRCNNTVEAFYLFSSVLNVTFTVMKNKNLTRKNAFVHHFVHHTLLAIFCFRILPQSVSPVSDNYCDQNFAIFFILLINNHLLVLERKRFLYFKIQHHCDIFASGFISLREQQQIFDFLQSVDFQDF